MSNQEIIDNAPEGATHATCGMYYWKWNSQSGWRTWCDVLVMWTTRPSPTSSVQSIADIKRIVELESKNAKMLECLCDISGACIGEITMSYKLDPEDIGQSIYAATGMTNPQMNAALKENGK